MVIFLSKEREYNYELALKNIVDLGKYSLELELSREESLIRQAGQMLTAFSFFSAALLMAIPIIITNTNVNKGMLLLFSGISAIPLIISLCIAVVAQWRFKYAGISDAKTLRENVYKNIKAYQDQMQYDDLWVDQLGEVHKSIEKNNNHRAFLVKRSMAYFLLSVLLIILSIPIIQLL